VVAATKGILKVSDMGYDPAQMPTNNELSAAFEWLREQAVNGDKNAAIMRYEVGRLNFELKQYKHSVNIIYGG
jgi:hypothetical protein